MEKYVPPQTREGEKNINLTKNLYPTESSKPLVSIIIPVYNEELSIENVINRIPKIFVDEIILVDDGSTDNSLKKIIEINRKFRRIELKNHNSDISSLKSSNKYFIGQTIVSEELEDHFYPELIAEFKDVNPEIKIIKHDSNQGYGASILSGLNYAVGDIIVTMDSDGQHNPEEIPNLIEPIIHHQADIVVGSRYLGKCNYKIPLHTRVGEFFIKTFLWLLYNQRVGNNQSGFRAFSRKSLRIFKKMRYSKFGLCTETLFEAAYSKLRIAEIPISLNPREYGHSYIRLLILMKSILSCILIYGLKKFKLNMIVQRLVD